MKHKITLLAVLMAALVMPTMAQNIPHTPPDKAKYSITGRMQYDNASSSRNLLNARGTGISFDYKVRRPAKPTAMADLVVRFDSVRTDPERPMTKLNFWRFDEELREWIYDREVRQGREQMESTMKTNIMLVIDNSGSLADDFKRAQDAAIEYVEQLYRASNNKDIFRVGVIGFSTVQFTRVRDIAPLDANNLREIVKFIRSLNMQNGTALYYSLDTALVLLERDAMSIPDSEYKESQLIAFTDGLDQASVADHRKLHSPTIFYNHLQPIMQGPSRKRIKNKIIPSTIVIVKGGDMTASQERVMEQRAAAICDDVRKLSDMSQLVPEFKKLAEDLIKSNMVLYCYIPVGAEGLVGWTFDDEDEPVTVAPAPKPQTPSNPKIPSTNKFWMGIGPEIGAFSVYDGKEYDPYTFGGLHLDFTFPMGSKFSLGATTSLFYNFQGYGGFGIGALAKFTNSNRSAFLLGVGLKDFGYSYEDYYEYFDGTGYWYENVVNIPFAYVSLGWKFKSRWYLQASVFGNMANFDMGYSLGLGYTLFGGK